MRPLWPVLEHGKVPETRAGAPGKAYRWNPKLIGGFRGVGSEDQPISAGCRSAFVSPIYPEDPFSDSETDRPQKDSLTPLHHTAISGLCDVATFLIVKRCQDLRSLVVNYDATPLHLASEFGHADFAQLLLEHGADTATVDDTGFRPLCWASYEGHAEVARIILERGAEINTNLNDFN